MEHSTIGMEQNGKLQVDLCDAARVTNSQTRRVLSLLTTEHRFTLGTSSHISLFIIAAYATMTEIEVEPPSKFASHEVRITQSGKIHAWVEFALKFFEVCEPQSLLNSERN